jgi:formate hydrogenlyase subunit 4
MNMDKKTILRYIIVSVFTIVVVVSGVYLGLRLWESSMGDFVAFCLFLSIIFFMGVAINEDT